MRMIGSMRAMAAMLVLACSGIVHAQAPATPQLIPQPASMTLQDGTFEFFRADTIDATGDAERRVADYFSSLAKRTHRVTLRIASQPAGRIAFTIDAQRVEATEGYRLDIDAGRIALVAHDEAGLFYGAVTLWQLLGSPDAAAPLRLPALHIDDAPRFPWRGVMLDSARHFQSVDEIKRLLDAMAVHKLNTFHWHLTDDQGWRIEIKRYPKLTSVGGCRIPAGDAGVGTDGKPAPYCGYYTQEQIRDVVRHAAQRHITVVPEIDVPGHATAAIAAYPRLGVSGKPLAVSNEWGVNTNLFNVEDDTARFLENVLTEVVDLFPGPYVHIGGDEAVKDQWEASARVQARMRALGIDDEMQMQGHLVARLEKFLVAHHRRLIGWDEILESELPAEATVMSWRGIEGGIDAARKGHDVVMAPSSDLYFDYLQTDSSNEPPGRPALIELRKVYAFEPVPAALTPAQRKHILGLQANVFTEHMRTFARVQHALFPRIAALAETAWSPAAAKNYDDFLARLPAQLQRYRALDIAYARTPFEVRMHADADRNADKATVALSNATGYRDIRYTTDGSAPTATSPRYRQPLHLRLPAQVKAAVFVDGKPLVAADEERFDATSLLTRSDEQLAMCTGALMLRLEDDGPRSGPRAIYNVDIFNPCWEWKDTDLSRIAEVRVRAGRMPYLFQLAHDESHRTFKPAQTAHGELVLRAGCDGTVLAQVPMPAQPDADGFVELTAALPAHVDGRNLCVYFTGDTRPTMWVLDRVTLRPRAGAR